MHHFFLHGVVLLGTAPPEELASKKDPVCNEGAQMCVCVCGGIRISLTLCSWFARGCWDVLGSIANED